jgi:hypothetical protein
VQVRSKVTLSKRLGKIRPPIRRCLATWFSLGIATLPCPNAASLRLPPITVTRSVVASDSGQPQAAKGSRGSDPRLLGLTMVGWLLDRTLGGDPVHQGSSMP